MKHPIIQIIDGKPVYHHSIKAFLDYQDKRRANASIRGALASIMDRRVLANSAISVWLAVVLLTLPAMYV